VQDAEVGRGCGTTPSIEQGPDGNVYVMAITASAIYKISHKRTRAVFTTAAAPALRLASSRVIHAILSAGCPNSRKSKPRCA
jgi:hypothetical protein